MIKKYQLLDMDPQLKTLYLKFEKKMDIANISFKVTCVSRSYKEQFALYAQGRESINNVNKYRQLAGLRKITSEQNKCKVTYTLKSKHLINLDDTNSENDVSKAFDIALVKDNKLHWDIKVSVNKNEIPDYTEAGIIGESVGLVWGGRFKNSKGILIPDYPHYQI